MRWLRSSPIPASALALVLAAAGCANRGDGGEEAIDVFAAASLTEVFTELGQRFSAVDGSVELRFNFGPSSALVAQIRQGSSADVVATADEITMGRVVEDVSLATPPEAFAGNRLVIAVPPGNPGQVEGLGDFADGELFLGVCAEEVPCGRYARRALARAGVDPAVDTEEPDVRALVTKVEAAELDAGIVYRSDVLAAGDAVDHIDIPPGSNPMATYWVAALGEAGEAELADAFVAFILSGEGRGILRSYGFEVP